MTRRAKIFGFGRAIPLDRNQKAKLAFLARSHLRARRITSRAFQVFEALLWGFHNAKSGRCYPSYERISEKVGCARSTVALALRALESFQLLTWHNRIVRVRIKEVIYLIRTSNAYQFPCLVPAKSEFQTGTPIKSLTLPVCEPSTPLEHSLSRLGKLIKAKI